MFSRSSDDRQPPSHLRLAPGGRRQREAEDQIRALLGHVKVGLIGRERGLRAVGAWCEQAGIEPVHLARGIEQVLKIPVDKALPPLEHGAGTL